MSHNPCTKATDEDTAKKKAFRSEMLKKASEK